MTPFKKLLPACFVVLAMGALLAAKVDTPQQSGKAMAVAANDFLGSLSDEQKQKATFAFDDAERLNWHFIPRDRKGVPLRELEGPALAAAKKLIASGLSEAGYTQSLSVMSLEEVLYLLEGGEREVRRERRHPGKYYLSIFGKPADTGSWGWRVEGHHLSLNYTLKDGAVVSSTPEFFGANPGFIDAGPERSIRVLGPEEDIARQLLKLCSPGQSKIAWISKEAPDEIRNPGEPQPATTEPVGLAYSQMNPDQQELLMDLLNEYLKNMPEDVSSRRRARIVDAGLDKVYFAWWGDGERNQRHHYRVQGPTFLIEYNNTQNQANHVHSVWRDLGGDFNIPIK